MRILFYLGWVLLIAAFLITGADPFLTQLGKGGIWTSFHDVWYAYAPHSLIISQIRIEKVAPVLWDPVILTILQVPGWLLFGLPGGVLVWTCRPNKVMSEDMREEYERQKESLFVLDELSREARKDENYDPHEDDQAPAHLMFDLHESEDDDMRAAVTPGDIPAGYPPPEYLEDWSPDLTAENADGMGGVNPDPDITEPVNADALPYDSISVDLDVSALPPSGSIVVSPENNQIRENESESESEDKDEGSDRKV